MLYDAQVSGWKAVQTAVPSEMHTHSLVEHSAFLSHLKDVEVPLVVLPKGMLAGSETVEQQHAIAEDVYGIALSRITPHCALLAALVPATHCCHLQYQGAATEQASREQGEGGGEVGGAGQMNRVGFGDWLDR